MGKEANSKSPASSVVAARMSEASWPVTRMNALTTGWCEPSVTFPRISAVL